MVAPPPASDELTVDQLASRVGMTVRNVRAYAARGLLPPPRLVGRTGFYGPPHVDRLRTVQDLVAEGYTLAAVQRVLQDEPATGSAGVLAVSRALLAPWQPDPPEETDLDAIAARAGSDDVAQVAHVVEQLTALGLVEPLAGSRLRVLDPALLDAGVRGVRLGLPAEALMLAQTQVIELVERAAQVYVQMFVSTVWQDFLDDGAPADGLEQVQAQVEGLPPVAAQALLASFRTAMAAAVAKAIDDDLVAALTGTPD